MIWATGGHGTSGHAGLLGEETGVQYPNLNVSHPTPAVPWLPPYPTPGEELLHPQSLMTGLHNYIH